MEFEIRLEDGTIHKYRLDIDSLEMSKDWFAWGLFDNQRYWERYPKLKPKLDDRNKLR